MSFRAAYFVRCRRCGQEVELNRQGVSLQTAAVRLGWTSRSRIGWLCPACRGTVPEVHGTLADRIQAKIDVQEDPNACWPWRGACSAKRWRTPRPVIGRGRRGEGTVNVARQICEWHQGPPPSADHQAGHTCPEGENSICVNYHHLRWMTRSENEQHKRTYVQATHGAPLGDSPEM